MKLKVTTNYAIKSLMYIANQKEVVTANEIGEKIGISKAFVISLLKDLKNAGFIDVRQGTKGGYIMSKKLENTNIYDVINITEGTFLTNKDVEYCKEEELDYRELKKFYEETEIELIKFFKNKKIIDLIK